MRQHEIFHAPAPVTVVRYQPANALLLCATQDGSVYGLDAADDFRPLLHLRTGLQTIDGLDVHPQEKVIALAGMGMHQIWDLNAQRRLMSESFYPYDQNPPGSGSGFCLRFHHSGWAIFGGYTFKFRAYNYKTGERRELFTGGDFNVWLDFHPSGNIGLASYLYPQDSAEIAFFDFGATGECKLYEEPRIQFLPDANLQTDIPVRSIFSPGGEHILSSSTNSYLLETREDIEKTGALLGVILVHGFPEYDLLHEIEILGELEDLAVFEGAGEGGQPLYGPKDVLSNVIALAEGRFAVCGTPSGQVSLVDCLQGVVAHQETTHDGPLQSVDSISRSQVVTGGRDGRLRLCDFSEEVGKSGTAAEAIRRTVATSSEAFFSVAKAYEDIPAPIPRA